MSTLFQSLSQEKKVDFFIKCQELMIKYHPESSFIVREKSLPKTLEVFQDNIQKYKGYSYTDDNICVLWNKIFVSDNKNTHRTIKENAYKSPHENYNGVSIDFAVFRKIEDCYIFIRNNYDSKMEYVLFIREGKPKLYPIKTILNGLNFS